MKVERTDPAIFWISYAGLEFADSIPGYAVTLAREIGYPGWQVSERARGEYLVTIPDPDGAWSMIWRLDFGFFGYLDIASMNGRSPITMEWLRAIELSQQQLEEDYAELCRRLGHG